MSRVKAPALKPGTWFAFNTVVGPSEPEFIAGRRYVRVECWSCKGRRDVPVDNLITGKSKRCKRCSLAARGRFQVAQTGGTYELGDLRGI